MNFRFAIQVLIHREKDHVQLRFVCCITHDSTYSNHVPYRKREYKATDRQEMKRLR